MRYLKTTAVLMTVAVLLSPTYTAWAQPGNGNSQLAHEQSYITRLHKRINTNRLMGGVEMLATGDDARLSGLEGEEEAAKNIAKEFKKLGLKTEIREFDTGKGASKGKGYVNVGSESYKVETLHGGMPFDKDFDKEIVSIPYGNSNEEYKDYDVKDKVVLVQKGGDGDASFINKIKIATENGAAAIIIYNDAAGDTIPWNTAGDSKIPALGMSKDDANKLLAKIEENDSLTLVPDIEIDYVPNAVSRNVVAKIPAYKNPKKAKTLVVGAHFDSVNCPGANDNASGTSVLMEAARLLSTPDMKKAFNYNIEFVAFGTEELGLSGSKAFVQELKDSGEIENIQAVINMDMVGNGDHMRIIQFEKNEVHEISKIAEKQIKENDIEYYGKVLQGSNRSDHYSFEIAGLPALTFMVAWDQNYHTDRDNLDNVNVDDMYDTSKLLVSTIIDMQDMSPRVHNPKNTKSFPQNFENEELGER